MLIKQPITFIFLSASGLKIYGKPEILVEVAFPEGLVEHQEITDKPLYLELIESLLSQSPQEEFILLIDDVFVYQKDLAETPGKTLREKKRHFLNMLPFDELKLAHKHVETDNGATLYALNKELYEPVLTIARKTAKKIRHILPMSLLHTDVLFEPSHRTLSKNYSRDISLLHDLNSAEQGIPWVDQFSRYDWDRQPEKENPFNRKLVSLLAIFGILVIILVLSIIGQNKKPAVVLNNKTIKAPVISPASTPTPIPVTYKSLGDLKVQILNASSVSGQAGRLERKFNQLGLSEIVTGTDSAQQLTDVLMLISNNVSASDSALLSTGIKSGLPGLAINSMATDSADFDVKIIIGNRINKNSVLE